MAEWNVSSDPRVLEQKSPRRSPAQWLRQNSLKLAVGIGIIEAIVAWQAGYKLLLPLVAILVVFAYLWARKRVPQSVRRPLWIVTMSQVVAAIILPAIVGAFLLFAIVAAGLLIVMALVLLGDLRRT
jgi:hypothetical protein